MPSRQIAVRSDRKKDRRVKSLIFRAKTSFFPILHIFLMRRGETEKTRPRSPSTLPQTDLTRALKAARAAGFASVRLEIGDGKIAIVANQSGEEAARETNEWDAVHDKHSA